MVTSKKITHTRVYKDTLLDFDRELPKVRHADIIEMAWQQYKAVQKAGRFIYGTRIWKKPNKR